MHLEETAIRILLHDPDLHDRAGVGTGGSIAQRKFRSVDPKQCIVDAQTAQGGQAVLDGLDHPGPVLQGGPSGPIHGVFDEGGNAPADPGRSAR